MTTYLRVRNFERLQHDTNRPTNPWIRFYTHMLDDEEIQALPVPTRYLWTQLLLLAQRNGNATGSDPERIGKLLRMDPEQVREGIAQLLKGRWLSQTKTPRRVNKRVNPAVNIARATERKKVLKTVGLGTSPNYGYSERAHLATPTRAENGESDPDDWMPRTIGGGYHAELQRIAEERARAAQTVDPTDFNISKPEEKQ